MLGDEMDVRSRRVHAAALCAALWAIGAARAVPTGGDTDAAQAVLVDPEGGYFLEAPAPDWTNRIDHLFLATSRTQGDSVVPAPLWGFLRERPTGRGRPIDYRLLRPTLVDSTLTFRTRSVNGVQYRFAGRYLVVGDLKWLRPRPAGPVLVGRLGRYRNGRLLNEADVRFTYSAGH